MHMHNHDQQQLLIMHIHNDDQQQLLIMHMNNHDQQQLLIMHMNNHDQQQLLTMHELVTITAASQCRCLLKNPLVAAAASGNIWGVVL
jgi:uncharacterized membrane protein